MTAKLTTRSPWWEFQPVVEAREPFKTSGAFRAQVAEDTAWTTEVGRLPGEYHESCREADYIVYSYGTPIAWHGPDGWTFPDEKYSVTTSRHQGKIFFVKDWV